MSRVACCLLSALVLLAVRPCAGHPGHGTTAPNSIEHQVLEPVHGWPLGATAAAALAGVCIWRRQKSR